MARARSTRELQWTALHCSENRNGLKESLLRRGYAADESGAEAGAPAPVKESSWYSLFGTALVFVWPDTPMDQVCDCQAFCKSLCDVTLASQPCSVKQRDVAASRQCHPAHAS